MFERDREILKIKRKSHFGDYADVDEYKLYAIKYDCSTAYIVSNYTSNPMDVRYETYILTPGSRMVDDAEHYFGHPKYCGVTKRNNWSVDPQYLK
jgi:hypothetical protein